MFQRQGPVAFKKDLGNIQLLCDQIGNPERGQAFIHVAGTNGKGSTSHILAGILQAQGYRVGLYTSPHYKDFRERIKINAEFIPKRTVTHFVNKYKSLFTKIEPSFFEITVALAFWYFKKEKVDFAIIETGLGGRLDSTNIITPLISVITNIGYDHQNMLGETLPEIAGEKAGIIKANVPVLMGEYQRSVVSVFREKAKSEKAPLYFAKDHIEVLKMASNKFSIRITDGEKEDHVLANLKTDLIGEYQQKNLKTAIAAYFFLTKEKHIPFRITSIKNGLKNISASTYFIGRWMQLKKQPRVFADSAHNVDGVKLALQQLSKIPHDQLHFVFGTVSDKKPDKLLNMLPKTARYYFAKADIPRGMNAVELNKVASNFGLLGSSYDSVKKAYQAALATAKKKDLIFVGGSIFVVAEVI